MAPAYSWARVPPCTMSRATADGFSCDTRSQTDMKILTLSIFWVTLPSMLSGCSWQRAIIKGRFVLLSRHVSWPLLLVSPVSWDFLEPNWYSHRSAPEMWNTVVAEVISLISTMCFITSLSVSESMSQIAVYHLVSVVPLLLSHPTVFSIFFRIVTFVSDNC